MMYEYIQRIPSGEKIPANVWEKCLEILKAYTQIGREFVKEGRPREGRTAERFREVEIAYNQMADAIWFAQWTHEQREEWHKIYQNKLADNWW